MERLKTYNLKLVQFVIGGRDISSYGESGGIEVEPGADVVTPMVGATGSSVISVMNNDSATVTVTVGEWTRAYKDLAELMQEQIEALRVGPVPELDFLLRDPLNGDRMKDEYCAFVTPPAPNKAQEAGERTFSLFVPNAYNPANADFGALNL